MRCLSTFTAFVFLVLHCNPIKSQPSLEKIGQLKYSNQEMSSIWGYTAPDGHEYVLAGTTTGMSIVDIKNPEKPTEIHFIPGSNGFWREIKTWKNFAYVSHDNNNFNEGILIIDLKDLPEKITTYDFKGADSVLRRAHTLYIDEAGYLYLFGGTYSVCRIYNLNTDPTNPTFVGATTVDYIHDGYVRGDTLWASNIYKGYITAWDLKDRTAPSVLTQFTTPSTFTHNAWLSDNSKYLFTTDETNGAPVAAYDVSDITDVKIVDRFKIKPSEQSIPHNVHVLNDYLIMSHYTQGVVIADASIPEKIVKIAAFDTSPEYSGGGFNGCWGVYPYFPSGLIAATDIEEGLYILKPTYQRAARIFGTVYDDSSKSPLQYVSIALNDESPAILSTFEGGFKLGTYKEGNFELTFSKSGYITQKKSFELMPGDVENIEIFMKKGLDIPEGSSKFTVISSADFAEIRWYQPIFSKSTLQIFNSAGAKLFETDDLLEGITKIPWKDYASGIYIFRVFNKEERFSTKVFKN